MGADAKKGRKGAGTDPTPDARVTRRPVTRTTRQGRERMQLLVDPELLRAASTALGARSKSDAVNAALRNAAENAAILRGIDAAIGRFPDFPFQET